jgi:hypothetical protein
VSILDAGANTRRSHAHRNVRADWVGKTITYDGGQFVLEGKGNIRAADVMEYDRQDSAPAASSAASVQALR